VDHDLFAAINGLAGKERLVDMLAVALSRFGSLPAGYRARIFWLFRTTAAERERRQRLVLVAVIAVTGSLLLNQILILIWSRPRPFAVQAATLLLRPSHDPSFPSDHATFAFAVAVALFLISKRIGVPALILAALIGLARVFAGEHYVTDVIGGALIGTLATIAVARVRYALEPSSPWSFASPDGCTRVEQRPSMDRGLIR